MKGVYIKRGTSLGITPIWVAVQAVCVTDQGMFRRRGRLEPCRIITSLIVKSEENAMEGKGKETRVVGGNEERGGWFRLVI
jgi:hypothetical protein